MSQQMFYNADPGPFYNTSNSPWYNKDPSTLNTNDQMASSGSNIGPQQSLGDRAASHPPATQHEKSARLNDRSIKKGARIRERMERARLVDGENMSYDEAKKVMHRERVGNELKLAANGADISHLGKIVQDRILKIRREYIPADPMADMPDYEETVVSLKTLTSSPS